MMTKMTIAPTVNGRKLPPNDTEDDDHTPGANGHYVTCVDTSVGRMVSFATNGTINKDGKTYRSSLPQPDSGGISLKQAAIETLRVAGLRLIIPTWGVREVTAQLVQCKGLVAIINYASLPRSDRYQDADNFLHCLFISHMDTAGTAMRVWDPLNPELVGWGRWIPNSIMMPALFREKYMVAYVPLEPL